MKILITGGAGFIGANLCKRLLDDGHEVVCMDNFFSSKSTNIEDLIDIPSFSLVEHDIIQELPEELEEIEFDQIYHLACPASPVWYQKDHIYTLRTNFEGTLNVLNFAKRQMGRTGSGPKILFTSTSEVYGNPSVTPQSEDYRGNVNTHGIRSCYDEGKRVAESLCMNFWRDHGLKIKIVRIFNTYGPKMDAEDGRAVSNFIVQALKGEKITVYGDGKQTRSFQYIDDLLNGMILFMESDENFPGPINLGNPHEITILKLVEKIIELTGAQVKIDYTDLPSDDPLQRCPNISLAKEKLNWEPSINLENGLKKTIEYFDSIF